MNNIVGQRGPNGGVYKIELCVQGEIIASQ
jgi:hypothetical protein